MYCYSFVVQMSNPDLTGLTSRCFCRANFLSGSSRRTFVLLPFSTSAGYHHIPWLMVPLPPLQSRQHHFFNPIFADRFLSLVLFFCLPLSLLKILVITLGPPESSSVSLFQIGTLQSAV
jgi:hypothetical protein